MGHLKTTGPLHKSGPVCDGIIGVWNWLKTNHEAASTTASIVANIITVAALITTIVISSCQMSLTRNQIDLTRRSLQNSLIYQLQKDERAAGADFFNGTAKNTNGIFAELQSVFIQRRLGSIPDDVWHVFELDFCNLMSSERLRRDWDGIDKKAFSGDFISYIDRVSKPGAIECGR